MRSRKKSEAMNRIESHEKLCRIMQKQTFEQIKELKDKINRIEKILLGTAAFIIVSLLEKVI